MSIHDISMQAICAQILVGLINGSFYAVLSLGLAIIFGLLRVINFAHGAQYMLGAFCAFLLQRYLGIGYWAMLLLAPFIVVALGFAIELTMLRRIYALDHLYGLLLTYGLALVLEGLFHFWFGSSGHAFAAPSQLAGGINLGFVYLPVYRIWVVIASLAVCTVTWLIIECTQLGSYLRAATEDAVLVQVFGINVPLLMTLTYAVGTGLAALAGVLAGPIYQVSPQMGPQMLIIVFAVVVIGGIGSIAGAIVTGYVLGILEGLTKVFYPEASSIVIFVIMIFVLLSRPAGLFGREAQPGQSGVVLAADDEPVLSMWFTRALMAAGLVFLAVAPLFVYPELVMKILCFGLFAASFSLLLRQIGLLSFGHAAFFGFGSYVVAYSSKTWGLTPELCILLGTILSALLGAAFGYLAIKRNGIYFSMITLALTQMLYFVCLRTPLTGGEDGIQGVPRGRLLGLIDMTSNLSVYPLVVLVFLLGMFAIWRVARSPFGNVLMAIRDNEARAMSLGYRVERYKLGVFIFSAALAGMAGGAKALVFQLASLTDVHWQMSGEVVLMALVGGIGTLFGPVVGAGGVLWLEDRLATSPLPVTVVMGTIFVFCVLLFRGGFAAAIAAWLAGSLGRARVEAGT
jgi:branched-chain amino acid transport system permease protein